MGETQTQTFLDDQRKRHGRRDVSGLKDDPQVIAASARLYEGLLHISQFAIAAGRSQRWVRELIDVGLPSVRIGKRHYINVDAARAWLLERGSPDRAPRSPGRPLRTVNPDPSARRHGRPLGSKNRPK